jgi:multisubunit Na+/H+ antiporter MnhB subunit
MNSLCWLAAFIASVWIADFFYGISEPALGFVGLVLSGISLLLLLFAVKDDMTIFRARRSSGWDDEL